MTKFTDTARTPAATTKFAAELADGSKGHILQSALRDLLWQQGNWKVIAASGVGVSHTGNTNKTALATVAVPAGAMGANGILRVRCQFSCTASTNSKTMSWEYGGGAFFSRSETGATIATMQDWRDVYNRNSQSSQIGVRSSTIPPLGGGTTGPTTASIDTSAAQNLIFYATLTNTGETITLENYCVEVLYQA